jgi:hypothetical protein
MTGRLVRFVWHDLPAFVGRVSRTLGVALTDGQYLAAWPGAALAAPVVALLAGAGIAAAQQEVTFTYSLVGLAIFAVLAGAGAGLGWYAFVGYVVVDLASGNPLELYFRPDALTVLQSLGAALISYLLLAALLVLVPLTALGLREEVTRLLRIDSAPVRHIVHTLLGGVLVWSWAQATAFLIRPVWSFHDRSPDVDAISTLQQDTWVLVLAGMIAFAGRGVAEESSITRLPSWIEVPPVDLSRRGLRPPVWVAVPLRAALLVVLMAGLLASFPQAVLLFVVLLVPLTVQALSGRLAAVEWVANRVPVVLRVAVAALAAYLIATVVVEPQVRATSSFFPMLLSVTLSLVVAAVLLPHREEY